MSWTFTSMARAVSKAGVNANSDIIASSATLADWSDDIEGLIETECHRKFSEIYDDLDSGVKGALGEATSAKLAQRIVAYDPTGYLAREADLILNLNNDSYDRAIRKLNDLGFQKLKG